MLGAPIAALGMAAGIVMVTVVGLTADRTNPPGYRQVLPFWGFFVVVVS